MIPMKKYTTILMLFVHLYTFGANSTTYNSYDEQKGTWDSNTTWDGENAPSSYVNGDVFNIKGTVIINSDITTSNKIAIYVEAGDTLIVNANLTLNANDNSFIDVAVADNGVLIVLGSLSTGNNLDVATSGKVVVLGSISTGSGAAIDNTGDMYVIGDMTSGISVTGNTIGGLEEFITNEPDLVALIESDYSGSTSKIFPELYAIADGNWSSTTIWSEDGTTSCGCIPTTTSHAIIDGFAVTLDTDAQISKLTLSNETNNTNSTLTLNTATTFTVSNSVILTNNQTSSELVSIVAEGTSTLDINGDLQFEGSTDEIAFVELNSSSTLDVAADITYNTYGNIYRNESATIVYPAFNDPTVIYGNIGNVTIIYDNITIADGSTYTTSGNVRVKGSLVLADGYIQTDASNLLVLLDGATSTPGSDASFVDGPLQRTGSTNFTFPIGDNGIYAPIGIQLESSTTSTYTAEYFATAPNSRDNKNVDLASLSGVEYWDLHKDAGVGAYVTLYFLDPVRSGVIDPSKLVLAHWNSSTSTWENMGMNGYGTNYVRSGLMTSFSPVTTGGDEGALPVELTNFTAYAEEEAVVLEWATASETNNDYFSVERSIDGTTFTAIEEIEGNGTTSSASNYTTFDMNPISGVSYYRLKQTDFDGTISYSDIVPVEVESTAKNIDARIYPNSIKAEEPINILITSNASNNEIVEITITDNNGKLVHSESTLILPGSNNYSLNLQSNSELGVFYVQVHAGKKVTTEKLIIR